MKLPDAHAAKAAPEEGSEFQNVQSFGIHWVDVTAEDTQNCRQGVFLSAAPQEAGTLRQLIMNG
jgi:hypothetical protein